MTESPDDPRTWELSTWLLAGVAALGGGIIDTFNNYLVDGKLSDCNVCFLISTLARMLVAGIIGLGAFIFSLALGYSVGMSAVIDGVAAHMGITLLYLLEKKIKDRIEKL